jgi:hypothetical protein
MTDGPNRSDFYTVTVTVAVVKLCGSSPARRALRLTTRGADVYIAPSAAVALGQGFRLVNGTASEELCACHVGDWVTRELYAIADGATATVHVIEGFEEDE